MFHYSLVEGFRKAKESEVEELRRMRQEEAKRHHDEAEKKNALKEREMKLREDKFQQQKELDDRKLRLEETRMNIIREALEKGKMNEVMALFNMK